MDATFWALVALVIFLGLLAYLKVPAMMAKSLDERADKIRDELAKQSACVKRPSTCWPNISASARKPRPKPHRSSRPPSAKPLP